MVKSDVRRDYYADLQVPPNAEAEEIKRQFRKLALKYHPDRNPGRETEFNAKFQAIQAAHEILSDPHTRLKYDTDRLRAGFGKFPTAPKTNTARKPQPAGAYEPPRPPFTKAPPPFTKPQPTSTPKGPSAGASRYAAHARAGQQSWHTPQDDAQTRADAFRGFSGMRGSANANAGASSGWRQFDPSTGHSTPGGTPRQQNQPFGNPRPKSAYERYQESFRTQNPSSNPHSPKKRTGFAPGTAGGDEPMARNTSAYTSSSRSERPSSAYFESAPPPTAKKPSNVDPSEDLHDFEPRPEFSRTSSRYATSGGEKTFFNSSRLGRSSTMRTPSGGYPTSNSRTNPPSPIPSHRERHRSASPKGRRERAYSADETSSDGDDSEEEFFPPPTRTQKPKAVPKSRLGRNKKPSDFYEQGDSSSGTGHNSDSAAFSKGQAQFNGSIPRPESAENKQPSYASFGRHSSSNLHKKFSEEDWKQHFAEFDFLGANARKEAKDKPDVFSNWNSFTRPRGRTTNRTDSTQSAATNGLSSPANGRGTHSQPQPQPQQAPTPFAQAKFSADQWKEQLRDMTWNVSDDNKTRPSSNTPPSRSPKKQARSGAKARSGPQPASVATEAEESRDTINGTIPPQYAQPQAAQADAEPEAMDLDEEVPSVRPNPAASDHGSASAPGSANTSYPDLNTHAPKDTPAAPKEPQAPRADNGTSKTETRTPLFNLDNLRNTAPFTSTNSGGIENLDDVFATLPFESRPKQQTTSRRDTRPRELKLPNPPKRPRVPEIEPAQPGSQQFILRRDQWNYYVSTMGTYMHEWNAFNRRMLLHFNTRQEAIETGLAPGWMSAVGDTSRLRVNGGDDDGPENRNTSRTDTDASESDDLVPGSRNGGFSAYLRSVEEDIQVRKHWEVACEMHRESIVSLGRLREWIRNGGKVV
ncbi:hypothetical protein N7532_007927 [Penicillium argentinense]|uniref:J domain-containing protein n=1 Tax=Penicillium argentinense TaxID=1131581 RepID=A0A9W9EWF2_9EURO|nr:uncharacterized protein N7532_007927 [Penicillium argentinense]KAJ5089243.1 hypothetical protein N7532_007927 [Penicillium argentinense]